MRVALVVIPAVSEIDDPGRHLRVDDVSHFVDARAGEVKVVLRRVVPDGDRVGARIDVRDLDAGRVDQADAERLRRPGGADCRDERLRRSGAPGPDGARKDEPDDGEAGNEGKADMSHGKTPLRVKKRCLCIRGVDPSGL